MNDLYTAGVFQDESIMEGKEPWLHKISTELLGIIQKTGIPEALQIGFLIGRKTLSWVCLVII